MGEDTSGIKVEIFTSPTCIHCKSAKEFFQTQSIGYTEYDVTKDPARRQEAVEKSGQMGVPVILVDGEVVIGFDEERLIELLGL
ncbi:MAG: NrdH-redoxin [Candidatus Lloydbacteria bacterium RIFCSPHIGHO2_02_FULL_51_22]|uniref:NrdH-redoxin n=2 Tax=Candidatus Lloydiibacteriota TaxID=1817910 RepID=A0A1G2DFS0_9BACT|nr:MAG: NrdH-redoxin [Candidatus Lloydbacteria bacterium RIFCSPHIGHO2_02_FULL_51_22]OGZ14759.1 MAG: NrdH-redoxin [Candidatus Lloydbacteria bacterium RIFCSPLOWO2_02_FULL_51_11]